jgi:hypothetical protein
VKLVRIFVVFFSDNVFWVRKGDFGLSIAVFLLAKSIRILIVFLFGTVFGLEKGLDSRGDVF